MVQHNLAVHRFHTRLALTGLAEDGPPLAREVGRVVRTLLPDAAARTLAPLLGSREGVLRIDRIALTLRLGRGEMSALRLADLIAREIAGAVAGRTERYGGSTRLGAGTAYWPDHASFAAAYIAHRLRIAPAPDWAFPDFRALDRLAAHEAALELIAARPAILSALARLAGAAANHALAAGLPEGTAAELIGRLAAGLPPELPADAEAEIAEMFAALPAGVAAAPGRAAVAAAAKALAARAPVEAATVRRVALLARLAVAVAALKEATLAAWGRAPVASDLAPDALALMPEPARRLAETALAPLVIAEPARLAVARLLDAPPQRDAAAEAPATRAGKVQVAAPRAIASRLAGIGLLMPTALFHDLPDLLSPAALNRTLAAAVGPEAENAARLDPLVAALAPFDPRDSDCAFPPVPDALRALIPEAHREGAAAGEGAAGWAACLTHAFAARLAGFEASSLAYLRREFLARPGMLHVAEGRLALVLDSLPLGVVLRHAGVHGWSGRLPQAKDALMRIEIRER